MKTSTLLAILCSLLIILGSLGWPVLRITLARSRGEIEAQQSFRLLQEKALTVLDSADAIQTSTWRANARLSMENDRRLLSLLIKQGEDTLLFALPASSPFYNLPDETSGRGNLFNAPEFSTIRSSAILANGLQIDALYMTFSQEELFRVLMETLLGLLLVSLSAASVLLFSPRNKLKTAEGNAEEAEIAASVAPADSKAPTAAAGTAPAAGTAAAAPSPTAEPAAGPAVSMPPAAPEPIAGTEASSPANKVGAPITVEETSIPEPSQSSSLFTEIDNFDTEIEDYDDDTSNNDDDSSDFDFKPDEPEIVEADSGAAPGFAESDTDPELSGRINAKSADSLSSAQADDGLAIVDPDPERLAEQMERDLHRARAAAAGYPDNDTVPRKKIPVQEDEIGGPQGLYDPATGLCWESYLRERLGAELRRAASFEQDLVLLVASWDTVSKDSEEYVLFAATLRDFFNFPDLSFGFGPDGVAVVLPNVDIDHAMRQTEELIKKLTFIIQNQAEELRYLEIFMGLSSRSGRIVDADRLIAETLVALKKARGERDTHIMAFRPDPERFRSYLTNR